MNRIEYLQKNLVLCANEGSIDPSEVAEYVELASAHIAELERELRIKSMSIDELVSEFGIQKVTQAIDKTLLRHKQ